MPIRTPQEVTDGYIEGAVAKATCRTGRLLVLSIFAGILIAMGAVASSTAAQGIADTGTARLVTGAIFPIGLMMVVLLGTELFTGNALMVTAVMDKRITILELLRNWGIVYVGNLIGAVGVAALMAFFGQFDIGGGTLAVYSAKVAISKSSLPWANAFVLGIFCNMLVCIAIYLGNAAHEVAGKLLAIFFPIMGFVVAGFEHCVANMYYIPAGIFASLDPAYSQLIAEAGLNSSALGIPSFLLGNLLPVTLGNIVGGACVGAIMYVAHSRGSKRKGAEGGR